VTAKGDQGHALDRLAAVIESRRGADPAVSYTARLLAAGRKKTAQKVGEEAVEAVIAALDEGAPPPRLAEESADLLYHLLVLWAEAGLAPAAVWAVLDARHGTGGLDEKRRRGS
jgi:phosphoribosyl-ATP pyrophosphohydrolase